MQQFSFKIESLNYIITRFVDFVVFFTIYSIVKLSVYNHLNNDIGKVKSHLNEIEIKKCYFPYSLEEERKRA
jgi:hypothetical protein